MPIVPLASLSGSRRAVIGVVAVTMLPTVVGGLPSPVPATGDNPSFVVSNRALSVVALGVSGWLALLSLRSRQLTDRAMATLGATRAALADQHDLLVMAGQVGRFGGWSVDLPTRRVHRSAEVALVHGAEPGSSPAFDETVSCYTEESQAGSRPSSSVVSRRSSRTTRSWSCSPSTAGISG